MNENQVQKLSDDELDEVAGGGCSNETLVEPYPGTEEELKAEIDKLNKEIAKYILQGLPSKIIQVKSDRVRALEALLFSGNYRR